MRDTAFAFFLAAVLCVAAGMAWGIQMGNSGNRMTAPAPARLNLVGWATPALFGVHCRLTPQAAGLLARIHAVVAIAGPPPTAASMPIFLVTILRHGFGPAPDAARADAFDAALRGTDRPPAGSAL